MGMKFGSLFSGCGTFDLGFERAGFECLWQCEIDKTCRSVLGRHWPNVYQYKDVKDIDRGAARVDVLCGGFPCQDLSVAGKRAGLAGQRSGLFFEFVRIAAALRPSWILIENVPGLLSSNDGRDMGTVLGQVAQLGYRFCYGVLDAQYFGVPQRRERVFVVGHLGNRSGGEVLLEPESLPGDPPPRREAGTGVAACFTAGDHPGSHNGQDDNKDGRLIVAACLNSGGNNGGFRTEPGEHLVYHALTSKKSIGRLDLSGETFVTHTLRGEGFDASEDGTGRGTPSVSIAYRTSGNCGVMEQGDKTAALNCATDPNQQIVLTTQYRVRRLTPLECERLQGLPDDWTRYGHDDKEICDSRRYHMIGNAGAVPVLKWIARRIAAGGSE